MMIFPSSTALFTFDPRIAKEILVKIVISVPNPITKENAISPAEKRFNENASIKTKLSHF